KAIDKYASFKSKAAAESNDESTKVDPRPEAIVERLFDKCIVDGKYQQAMGTAIECRRLRLVYYTNGSRNRVIVSGVFALLSVFAVRGFGFRWLLLVRFCFVIRFSMRSVLAHRKEKKGFQQLGSKKEFIKT
ncbi:26S proteasome non-ATPase regulatory subunit 1-like protein, partial [Trifolium pratense]